jgi:hypothetical protein
MATRVSAASIKAKNARNNAKKAARSSSSTSISSSHQASKNAALLKEFGSPEAKALNAKLPSKSSSNNAPTKAKQEAETLNQASPTESIQQETRGNVILGSGGYFNFGQPTIDTRIQNLVTGSPTGFVKNKVENEVKQSPSITNTLADLFVAPLKLGGDIATKTSNIFKDVSNQVNQDRVEKAAVSADAERQIAESSATKDLFDTTFLERFGIGRSAEERRIQELIAQEAFLNQQANQANLVSEAFRTSQQATSSPDFQNAGVPIGTQGQTSNFTSMLVVGGLILAGVVLLK